MAKERGLFRSIFKHFVASLKPSPKPILIGEDHNGVQYFEQPPRPSGTFKRNHRYFKTSSEDLYNPDIPAAWEACLRHRRKEPPTEEEVKRNLEIMKTTKQNAAELEKKYLIDKYGPDTKNVPPEQPKTGSFPIYEEYKDSEKK